jgi:hypothetical protein
MLVSTAEEAERERLFTRLEEIETEIVLLREQTSTPASMML